MSNTVGKILRGNGHRFFIEVWGFSTEDNSPVDGSLTVKAYLTASPYGSALTGTTVNPLTALTDPARTNGFHGTLGATEVDAAVAALAYVWEEYFDASTNQRLGEPRQLKVIGW